MLDTVKTTTTTTTTFDLIMTKSLYLTILVSVCHVIDFGCLTETVSIRIVSLTDGVLKQALLLLI